MIWIAGCLNGGGQIKPKLGESAKDLIQQLETIYVQNVRVYPVYIPGALVVWCDCINLPIELPSAKIGFHCCHMNCYMQ